jgi:serine protease Do
MTKVDGKNIFTFADVYDVLEKHKTGDKVKVTLYRPDTEKSYDITVKLQEDKQ